MTPNVLNITAQMQRINVPSLHGGNGLAPNKQENDMTNLNNEIRELTTGELNDVSGGRSDLGQQLQLTLQEANNIFTPASKAQSDVSAKYSQFHGGIAQNFK